MGCNCQWTEIIIGIVILVFSWWNFYSQWVITLAAVILLMHALVCKNCKACSTESEVSMPTKKAAKKKKK